VPGHKEAGMVGTLKVQAGGAPAPAAVPAGGTAPAGAAAPAGGGAAAPAAAQKPLTIEAYDIGWKFNGDQTAPGKPIVVIAAAGTKISLPNTGASPHNFSIDKLGIKVDMPAGQTVETTVPGNAAPGDYEFYCDVPGHKEAGMVGTLTIK
jgi:plastocyanin